MAIVAAPYGMNGYQYRCVATNVLGSTTSDAAVLTVNKMTATVTLSGGMSATYDGQAHSATAVTLPAGLTVDFTYSEGAVAPINAGSYAVLATINDPIYQGSVSGVLSIAKASLIAKADDQSKNQGQVNPALTISYSGFVNGETATVLDTTPTASTTASASSPAGTYPITLVGGADHNYVFTLQDGTLTVVFAPTAGDAGNVASNKFTAIWSSVSGATGYRLDVATDSSFSSFVSGYKDYDEGNTTSAAIVGLSPNTTYYYRIQAYNGAGAGPYSNAITVTTIASVVTMTPLAFSTLAGQPLTSGSADGAGSIARFNHPSAVAADNVGNV